MENVGSNENLVKGYRKFTGLGGKGGVKERQGRSKIVTPGL